MHEADLDPLAQSLEVEVAENYLVSGSRSVQTRTQRVRIEGCNLDVGVFTPAEVRSDVALVIAPGFALFGIGSSRANLDTLARHTASWGVTTYTVSLCTNGAGIDHPRNGAVLAAFGESLATPVLYAGFSGGGLSALIAAADTASAAGFLALDAVDANGLALAALASLTVPAHALVGEPSSCNASSNMVGQYTGLPIRALKINRAQHFTFEGAPCRGFRCLVCSGGGDAEAQAIRALTTAFALGVSGASDTALDWWDAHSAEFIELRTRGIVTDLQ